MPVRFISNEARSRDSEGSHRIRIARREKRAVRTKDIKAAYENYSNLGGHMAPDHDERKWGKKVYKLGSVGSIVVCFCDGIPSWD